MTVRIEVVGSRIRLSGPAEATLGLDAATRARWSDWTARYRAATGPVAPGTLLDLGREMFGWLDESGWARAWADAGGARRLEIAAQARPTEDERMLLDLPWEVLADATGHLAAIAITPFEVWRRVGSAGDPVEPAHRDLSLLFMAASPRGGGRELDYEAEEAAIVGATERLGLSLSVEESGCAEFLSERFDGEEAFEAIHLSCHGDVLSAETAARFADRGAEAGPALLLETPEGGLAFVSPGRLARIWGGTPPGLVFLSACRTAESAPDAAAPYARELTRAVPAVLGWGGSVYDRDAIAFAEPFYRALGGYETPAFAARAARLSVLERHMGDPKTGTHWHLARLWLGPGGGGPLAMRGKPRRRLPENAGYKAFLDKERNRVPVAGPLTFVGRRREAQAVIGAFRENTAPGVLIHGMGNLGKSSLAARVANRLPKLKAVVVYEHYDPLAVVEQVAGALPAGDRDTFLEEWRPRIEAKAEALALALETLLDGPFFDKPIVLIVDDLEQVLEAPAPGQTLTPVSTDYGWRTSIAAVLAAFGGERGDSRLLFTSRYDFAAPDGNGRDLAADLVRVPLTPFDPGQRDKQWRAALETRQRSGGAGATAAEVALADERQRGLRVRALEAANGNPGLQDILTRPLLAGEFDAVEDAIDAIDGYLADPTKLPGEENAAFEFFRRMTFERYGAALAPAETALLRALCVFGEDVWPEDVDGAALRGLELGVVPIPAAAMDAVGVAAGVGDPAAGRTRLAALGLLDVYTARGSDAGVDGYAVNRFARPLVEALEPEERKTLATVALQALQEAWTSADGDWPADPRGVEAARTALLAGAAEALQPTGRAAFACLHERISIAAASEAGLAIGEAAVAGAAEAGDEPDLILLRRLAEAAGRLGHGDRRDALLRRGRETAGGDARARAQLDAEQADRLAQTGDPDAALARLSTSVETFERLGDVRLQAVTMGRIADVLQARGETDEALRVYREQLLPVFERLGDVRSKAVTMGKIADVLQARGDLDEALRIRREEQLPVYERLGDVRAKAVTMGRIADVLQARGETDEALRIRREEALPVYERLGDVRAKAATMGRIADVLQARGETDEALRIRREEELPVYERLGDVRAKAVTMGKIANVLQDRGETDEALRIRREEQLPVYERLGDVRLKAVTMGKIANVLQDRGETDEALRIRREEELPVYERLGDVRSKAVTMGRIADVLQDRGETDEALRIRREEELPVYERLGDVRSKAVTMGRIADVLQDRGETDEALRIRREEELPVYERLGDVRSKAVTMGQIADVLQARGETDEALRIRREEMLPVFERLGDVRSKAVTMGRIADVLQDRGETDEALRIRREEELPVYERLGDVRSKAVTMGKIASVLQARGETDEALRIRREEQLPVYERLGDVRSKAVTMGKFADVLQERGELDEALRIRCEEELPVYERLGDVRSKAVTMGKIAIALLEGALSPENAGEIVEVLAEALPIFERLDAPDVVAFAGFPLARVLSAVGRTQEALALLAKTHMAFGRLANAEGVRACDDLWRQIEGGA